MKKKESCKLEGFTKGIAGGADDVGVYISSSSRNNILGSWCSGLKVCLSFVGDDRFDTE